MRNLSLVLVLALLILGVPLVLAVDPLFGTLALCFVCAVLRFVTPNAFLPNLRSPESPRAPPFPAEA